ncbi:hydrogenase maturation nickel metallochaperone HypA [Actinoallomurus sp. NPDC050550]|uniref:hydrogenase maturation nickel metallochaperone HypA n=1 Tax=Actinoallomurus sp. NPDC050550 TaxID=3154937 RepID=UPI0033C550FD
MHEMGLCDAIVDAAVRRARGRRVTGVRVSVAGHPVDPDVIDQGFQLAAAGTVAEGASVELVLRPPSVHCRGCGARNDATDALVLAACPRCGGIDVDAVDAEEVVLESIAFEPAGERRP